MCGTPRLSRVIVAGPAIRGAVISPLIFGKGRHTNQKTPPASTSKTNPISQLR